MFSQENTENEQLERNELGGEQTGLESFHITLSC